jgi:hypothetical protein
MKFLVSDKQPERHERIRAFLTPDTAVIAALLAAVDLEWTIRRVIDMALGGKKELVEKRQISGLANYAKAWNRVVRDSESRRLQDVVGAWDELLDAYQLRHDIVHGRQGTSGVGYVTARVDRMLAASKAVAEYGRQIGFDPYRRIRGGAVLTGPTRPKSRRNTER